ncbi:MAG: type II secretion system F family protein [Planctomycetes bacterium]|nr:type II secretion system F family protein [Planctomycetota bacterium]
MARALVPDIGLGWFLPRISDPTHDKVTLGDKLSFFRQLSTLFRAGTPLYQALVIASDQSESKQLTVVLKEVAGRVASGESLSEALGAFPELFKPEWTQLVKSGESSGLLGDVLQRLAEQIDAAAQFRSKIISALMYPIIVLCVSMSAVAVMLIFVVPTFASMFADMGKELPQLTQNVMAASNFLRARGLYLLAGIVGGFMVFKRWIQTPNGSRAWCKFTISMPLAGDLMVQTTMQQFSQNLSALLQSGVPLLESIDSLKGDLQQEPGLPGHHEADRPAHRPRRRPDRRPRGDRRVHLLRHQHDPDRRGVGHPARGPRRSRPVLPPEGRSSDHPHRQQHRNRAHRADGPGGRPDPDGALPPPVRDGHLIQP